MISEHKYISLQGAACPSCGSCQIEASGFVEVEGATAWQSVHCLVCGSRWVDSYKLQGYFNFTSGVTQSRCFVSKTNERLGNCMKKDDDGRYP